MKNINYYMTNELIRGKFNDPKDQLMVLKNINYYITNQPIRGKFNDLEYRLMVLNEFTSSNYFKNTLDNSDALDILHDYQIGKIDQEYKDFYGEQSQHIIYELLTDKIARLKEKCRNTEAYDAEIIKQRIAIQLGIKTKTDLSEEKPGKIYNGNEDVVCYILLESLAGNILETLVSIRLNSIELIKMVKGFILKIETIFLNTYLP